ncbi:MAG: TonB-dependent receptor [Flavipsychrobacter sp.]|nr:TonB-dependent receptor [Flavipsychrobacter sp.]
MYIFRFPVVILILAFFTQSVLAQPGSPVKTGSVSGKLADAKNNPVSYATVTLLRSDSSVVNGDLSKDDGSFNIAPAAIGKLRLRIESIGMATRFINVELTEGQPDKKLGTIKIAETENKLKEVSVVGEKAVMELKVDKKVFNVEKNTTTAGGSATDVLQNVPAVSVDADGNVSLRGKSGVTILIDGKPATMLGADVNSALQSLPASSIDNVEVITNPSAKYDAQGTSGIINIITKKDGRFGMNGSATLGAGTRDKYNGNFSINARKGKWNVFLNSSFRVNNTFNNVITDRQDYNATRDYMDSLRLQSYHTYEHVPRSFNGNFNTIGATYDLDKNNSVTVTENLNMMEFKFRDNSTYDIYDHPHNQGNDLMRQYRYSSFSGGPRSSSSSVDYKHKFKKKDEEINIDGTFAYTAMNRYQDYTTTTHNPGRQDTTYVETAPGTGNNSSVNIWADYTDPLTKNGKLGLGFKSQLYWFNSGNDPQQWAANDYANRKTDSTLLSVYNYTQQTHAAYVNWSDQLGKFSYQGGLRLEDAEYNGNGRVPRYATFKNDFVNLFPSVFISYQLPHQQSIYLNYSRRVNRPGFMQLLPFVDVSNPSTVNRGNPDLVPEFINNVEFNYSKNDSKGNNFIFSAYYAYTQNLTQKITRPLDSAEAVLYNVSPSNLFTEPVNIASGTTYGLEGTGHLQLLPIWDATVNLNFFQNQLIIGNGDTTYSRYLSNNSGFSWFGKINTNLKLPKNFSFQVNANYESPKVIAQGNLKQTYWIDLALKKTLWKNKATLILNCSDILKTHIYVTDYNLTAYGETINRVRETRIMNLTFTYRFGKSDLGKNIAGGNGGKRKSDDKLKPVKPNDEDRQKNLKEGGDDDGGNGGGGMNGGNKKGNGGGN